MEPKQDIMLSVSNFGMQQIISKEDLKEMCPMAFLTEKTNPDLSERYVQVRVEQLIDDFAKLGWYPVEGEQVHRRKPTSVRSLHRISFQNPDVYIVKDDGSGDVECYPRIILINSHDGLNSFKFLVGLFRLVCTNGLVIGNKMADMSIRHINYSFDELRKQVAMAIKQIEDQCGVMTKMSKTLLTDEQKKELATMAVRIRKGIPEGKEYEVTEETIEAILSTRRDEDKGNSLWKVFNVLQENAIKGGYILTNPNGKERKQRGIKSIQKDISVNRALFDAAESFIPQEAI